MSVDTPQRPQRREARHLWKLRCHGSCHELQFNWMYALQPGRHRKLFLLILPYLSDLVI